YSFENMYQRFPIGYSDPINPVKSSWMWSILPFVEQQNLYNSAATNSAAQHSQTIPLYYCPSEPRSFSDVNTGGGNGKGGYTDYVGIGGVSFFDNLGMIISSKNGVKVTDVTDGTSNTIMLGEHPPAADWLWGGAFQTIAGDVLGGAANTQQIYTQNQQGQL